jgi:hypothetical protein
MNDPLDMHAEILVVAASHGATDVRVFGSAARNEQRVVSDLDLLVRMEEGRSLFDLIALTQDLEDRLDVPVDVLSEDGLSPYLRDRVLSEAVPL